MLGAPTALFIGMGVAIGSGIFRTPGDVAAQLRTPWLILAAWVFGGGFVLMAGMVTAELATRFPRAGGEYVFLREAYGEFVAFFFGWAYTVFIIGGGAASIAAAFGDFGCALLGIGDRWSGLLAAGAIVAVAGVNIVGLRTGAWTQNVLTCAKIGALLTLIAVGLTRGRAEIAWTEPLANASGWSLVVAFTAGVVPVLWAYDGTTDAVKMAEEVRDVRRTLPRALIGSAILLTTLYVLVNVSLMRILPPSEMAGSASVPGAAMRRVFGPAGETTMLVVAIIVCLGSLSSTTLATVRVTFALARDGLTFRFMARMSRSQAPVPALLVVAGFSVILVLNRRFGEVLRIYFFASALLFGLSYASLIVFRLRDARFPAGVYRCPAGVLQAAVLILIQLALAARIVATWIERGAMWDAVCSVGLLGLIALLYVVWKRFAPGAAGPL